MLILCGGALAAGVAVSLAVPFVPFAVALILAIGIGVVLADFNGAPLAQIVLCALGVLVSTQIGYGLGLVARAALGGLHRSTRSASGAAPVPTSLSDLHAGEKR